MEVKSIGPGEDGSRVHRICQSEPGQDQHGVGRQRGSKPCRRRAVQMMAGIDMVHVPYRGEALALPDLISGQVQVYLAVMPASLGYIRAGKLRALAVTTSTRQEVLPDIPTVGEFLPGYEARGWYGVVVPKATPVEIVGKPRNQCGSCRSQHQTAPHRARSRGVRRVARRFRKIHRRRN
jgi:hypothetical protein